MTWYAYHAYPAVDPATRELIASGAEGFIYAPTDTEFTTPLPIFDLAGAPLASVTVGDIPVTTEFQVEDAPEVRWKSGSYILTLTSSSGLIEMAQGADTKAQSALDGLADLASTLSSASIDAATALAIATAVQDSLASADQFLPAGGADGDILYRAGERAGVWAPPPQSTGGTGGAVDWSSIQNRPDTFPPSAHTHTASQVSDATTVGRSVMTAASAQAARAAIGAGTGNGTSDLKIGPTATDAAAGNHAHPAAAINYTPAGGITATNVQDAIAQAAQTGGSGASQVYVWRYTAGAWPVLPATRPAGVLEVRAFGPSFPTSVPGWVGLAVDKVPLSYSKVSVA